LENEKHEQRSEGWFKARMGKVTASRISDVIARTKNGWGVSRQNYLAELAAERLTGELNSLGFVNEAMLWGQTYEREAREVYAAHKAYTVEEVGFIDHPTVAMSGASPDGLAGREGLVEIKCPISSTHIETLRHGVIPLKYQHQMQWQMASTGRLWCDFVSYDPRMPEGLKIYVQRMGRNSQLITELEFMVVAFNAEVDEMVEDLHKRYGI
jgi:putative phage-type endonuclease